MPPKKKSGVGQKGGTKRSGYGRFQVDLMMECEDEELSPAQLIAMKKAQEDHDKVCVTINPLPYMPILGSSNSAESKDMMSKILTNGYSVF